MCEIGGFQDSNIRTIFDSRGFLQGFSLIDKKDLSYVLVSHKNILYNIHILYYFIIKKFAEFYVFVYMITQKDSRFNFTINVINKRKYGFSVNYKNIFVDLKI